jgi:hypothetical protein
MPRQDSLYLLVVPDHALGYTFSHALSYALDHVLPPCPSALLRIPSMS